MGRMLRLTTVGNVDDGKSTLIGRLLYDSKTIFADQLDALERTSLQRGDDTINLALLTDGLRAEREQGITIDVAYRYFATARRKFVIADTPGHIQYTRNMVTGASTADLALVLVDARRGVQEQSRRHTVVASLLGIPHVLVCVNKMDLVGWSRERFEEICQELLAFAARLDIPDLSFIPLSALTGDNVVHPGGAMPWYGGGSLLDYLEQVQVGPDRNLIDVRFPVQYVIRPRSRDSSGFRGYAGTLASGVIRENDRMVVLPGGRESTITAVWGPGGRRLTEAVAGQAVVLRLADELDIGRGDLLCRPNNRPYATQDVDAMICWLTDERSLARGARLLLRHTTCESGVRVEDLCYRLDINTLHRVPGLDRLCLNDVGRVRLRADQPLLFDSYRRNRHTGSFVLIDEPTGHTVAAGMILEPRRPVPTATVRPLRTTSRPTGATVWLRGAAAAEPAAFVTELGPRLAAAGVTVHELDAGALRRGPDADPSCSADPGVAVRRLGQVARILAEAGVVAVVDHPPAGETDLRIARAAHDAAGLPFVVADGDASTAVSVAEGVLRDLGL
jgi:bifunctional enzyme CysN/CysC